MSESCTIHGHRPVPCWACAGAQRHLTRIKAEQLAGLLKGWIGEDDAQYQRAEAALRPLLFDREHQEVQRHRLIRDAP